jgi:hypothetical protein
MTADLCATNGTVMEKSNVLISIYRAVAACAGSQCRLALKPDFRFWTRSAGCWRGCSFICCRVLFWDPANIFRGSKAGFCRVNPLPHSSQTPKYTAKASSYATEQLTYINIACLGPFCVYDAPVCPIPLDGTQCRTQGAAHIAHQHYPREYIARLEAACVVGVQGATPAAHAVHWQAVAPAAGELP